MSSATLLCGIISAVLLCSFTSATSRTNITNHVLPKGVNTTRATNSPKNATLDSIGGNCGSTVSLQQSLSGWIGFPPYKVQLTVNAPKTGGIYNLRLNCPGFTATGPVWPPYYLIPAADGSCLVLGGVFIPDKSGIVFFYTQSSQQPLSVMDYQC